MSPDLKLKIVAAFESQLHEGTVRALNAAVLPPEIEGEQILDDEGYVPEDVEAPYVAALTELVNEGVLQTMDVFGMTAYCFSRQQQEKLVDEGKLPHVPDFGFKSADDEEENEDDRLEEAEAQAEIHAEWERES